MPRRSIGRNRGTGSRRTTFLDALVNAVVGEVRDRTKTTRRNEARQEARLPPRREPSVGAVRLGLRRDGEVFTDYSGTAFRGPLTNGDAADSIDSIVARRMRDLGIEPSADVETVDVNAEVGSFARRLSFDLRIAGTHAPSGQTNQRILEYRQAEGRDFAADTTELRAHVESEVRRGIGSDWDDDRASRIASDAILAWIIRRVDEQGVDIDLAPLSPAYRASKAAAGLDTRIGIATGAWRRALARAEVMVTA